MNQRRSMQVQALRKQVVATFALCTVLVGLVACGGGDSSVKNPAAQLESIHITPSTSLLLFGSNRQLQATGIFSDGSQRDVTTQVTWSATSSSGSTNFVTVAPNGMATGAGLGTSVVRASLGPVVGLLQLTVNTDGYAARTTAILPAVTNKNQVDAAYQPISQFKSGGVYTVQVVNLDADLTSTVLPVQTALIASIPMPAGFLPNATAASQTSLLVAVISYSSPKVIVIDASNDPTDPLSNTVIGTFIAPLTQSVSFGGQACMICAVQVDPLTDQLLLSTAQGYYTMDFTSGVFTALQTSPPVLPAPSFNINPVLQASGTAAPYALSPTFGQNSGVRTELQTIDLSSGAVSSISGFGLAAAGMAVIDSFSNQGAVVDAAANDQLLLNLTDPKQPSYTKVSNLGVCPSQPAFFDMAALGMGAGLEPSQISPTLFLSQHSGSCVGFEVWPTAQSGMALDPSIINYGYGVMPPMPSGDAFINGGDRNAIMAFTSIANKKNYGLLVSSDQRFLAKIDFAQLLTINDSFNSFFLPEGTLIPAQNLNTGIAGAPVIYLPTTGIVALSASRIDFGTQTVGTSVASTLILTNTSTTTALNISQIALQGPDASDFSQTNDCPSTVPLSAKGTCTINLIFTPGAKGARSATLAITDDGGNSPQTVALSGTGS